MTPEALETPVLVIDADVLAANVSSMAARARSAGVALRPHAKTHKLPQVARLQLDAGADGLTVAKLGEAEVFVDAGVDDVLVAYPIVCPQKLDRLVGLADRARISVSLDGREVADRVSRAAARSGVTLGARVEVDTGMGRLGAGPGAPAVELARYVGELPGLRLEGVMTHEGHAYQSSDRTTLEQAACRACEAMVATAEAVRAGGIEGGVVSVGASATARFAVAHPGVTEIRPGTYVFNDRTQIAHGAATAEDVAATVLTTVVGRPSSEIAVVDAGTKALTSERMIVPTAPADFGAVAGHGWPVVRASEEHGLVAVPDDADVVVGDRLAIVPNHICPVVNLFDEVAVVQHGDVVERWPVAARGRLT